MNEYENLSQRTLVIAWMPFEPAIYATWARRAVAAIPMPARACVLSTGSGAVAITRTAVYSQYIIWKRPFSQMAASLGQRSDSV
jgi:hypothetical protein